MTLGDHALTRTVLSRWTWLPKTASLLSLLHQVALFQSKHIDTRTHISVVLDVKNACWGGLMSAGAKSRNVQGVIIDGRVRDLAEHRSMGFPVSIFANDTETIPYAGLHL